MKAAVKTINFRSVLSLVMALVTVLSVTVTVPLGAESKSSVFSDVVESDWFYENVSYVYENGIMKGISEESFAPRATMTRAMSATILYRLAVTPSVEDYSHPFTDVKSGLWYSDAVTWAYGRDIVNGVSDTEFAPDKSITRAEFATMFWRYAEANDLALPAKRNGNIADETSVPFYARTAVRNMYRAEIINGKTGYIFDSKAEITRSEAAAIIERFNKNAVPKDSITENVKPEYDPDLYIDIAFIGNSFMLTGGNASHFDSIADATDERYIRVRDYSKYMYTLGMHISWFTCDGGKEELEDLREYADIVVFQESAGWFPDEEWAETLMDLIGRDKKYYAVLPFDGPTANSDNNYTYFKNYYIKEHNIELIYICNVTDFDRSAGLKHSDYLIEGDYHPNSLFGYAIALGMYCVMFDEVATEQNNGDLSMHVIPGETESEKYEYLSLLKSVMQRIVEAQT